MNKYILIVFCLFGYGAFAQSFNTGENGIFNDQTVSANYSSNGRFGSAVAIDGEWMIVGDSGDYLDENGGNSITFAGSASIYRLIAGVWVFQNKLVSPQRESAENFGNNVDIKDGIALVGAPMADTDEAWLNTIADAGAAYVFKLNAGVWTYDHKVVQPIADRETDSRFGTDVEIISATEMMIGAFQEDSDELGAGYDGGAMGAVYNYTIGSGASTLNQKIIPNNPYNGCFFGRSIDVDGDVMVVGAESDQYDVASSNPFSACGAIYIFRKVLGTWVFEQKLTANVRNANQRFGYSVDIEGDKIVVGASLESLDELQLNLVVSAGAVYTFHHDGSFWVFDQKITHTNTRGSNDQFGQRVSMHNGYLAVGSSNANDENNLNPLSFSGNITVYSEENYNYTPLEVISVSDRAVNDFGGLAPCLRDGWLAMGVENRDHPVTTINVGKIYMFEFNDLPEIDFIDPNTGLATGGGVPDTTICSNDTLMFDIDLVDEDVNSVVMSAQSDNLALVPLSNITFSGTGATRTVEIAPVINTGGVAEIIIEYTDNFAQTGRDTFNLVVNQYTDVVGTFNIIDTLCSGEFVVNIAGSPAGPVYTWDQSLVDGQDVLVSGAPLSAIVTGVDVNGCIDTGSVFVDPALIYSANDVSLSALDTSVCSDLGGTLIVSGPDMGLYDAAYIPGIGATTIGDLLTGVNFNLTMDTTLTVVLTGSNGAFTCEDTLTLDITVENGPSIPSDFVSNGVSICGTGADTVMIGSTDLDGNGYTYSWTPNGDMINSTTSTPSVWPTSTTNYTVSMFDPTNGCTSAASGTVTVTDPASVTLNLLDDAINIDLGESGTIDLTANDNTTNAGAIQEIMMSNNISYTFMNGVIDYTGITVGVDTISYSSCDVVCYNICDSAIVSVTVREVIPFTAGNFGLSPNGDGNGDELVFPGLENADDSQITLVNRWGDIVYSEAPYSNNWAGINSDGTALSNGTYYYVLIVTFAGEQTEHTGYIEIIK